MSGNNRWLTKEDILNDLAEVTGRTVTNIDDRFTLRGERPPPVNVPDDDDELQMYNQCNSGGSTVIKPDLSGITHMLRMVNDYYDSATSNDNENIKELKNAGNTVISISKLDVNVPEFVPRNVRNVKSETKIVEIEESVKSESTNCLEIKESNSNSSVVNDLVSKNDKIQLTDSSQESESNNNDIDVTKKIDISSLNSNEIEDIREKLKLKIVGTSKAECLTKKRDRNLAMASLLKLYTDIPKCPKTSPPLKLMTPGDFQTASEDVSDTVGIAANENITNGKLKKETVNTGLKHLSNTADHFNVSSLSPNATSQESNGLLSDKDDANVETQCKDSHMSKEVEESVKKVDKWLNGPETKKHKSRSVYFGPVTFKRKAATSVTSSESASLPIIDNIDRPSSVQTVESFVPSSYAIELSKSYTERSQLKAARQEDMWTKLERQLQEKDKAIKEQSLSKQAQM